MSKLKYYRVGEVDIFFLKNPSPVVMYNETLYLFKRMGTLYKLATHTPNGKRLVRIDVNKSGDSGETVILQDIKKSLFEISINNIKFVELSIEGIILDKLKDLEYIINLYPNINTILYRVRKDNITIYYKNNGREMIGEDGFFNLNLPRNFNTLLGYVEF
jgi:hypothetical protein